MSETNPDLKMVAPEDAKQPVGLTQEEVMTTQKSMIWGIRMIAQVQLSEPNAMDRSIDVGVRYLNHFVDEAAKKLIEEGKLQEKDAVLVSRFGDGITPETVARGIIMAARMLANDLERDFDDPNSGLMVQLQDMIDHSPTMQEHVARMGAATEGGADAESAEEAPSAEAPAAPGEAPAPDPDAPSAT